MSTRYRRRLTSRAATLMMWNPVMAEDDQPHVSVALVECRSTAPCGNRHPDAPCQWFQASQRICAPKAMVRITGAEFYIRGDGQISYAP